MRTLGMVGEVVGMAASICAKEDIYPCDVYQKRLDKLKEMMRAGVPIPAYHSYGYGNSEWYHFKDAGHVPINADNPEIQERIKALKVQHKTE